LILRKRWCKISFRLRLSSGEVYREHDTKIRQELPRLLIEIPEVKNELVGLFSKEFMQT